MGERLTAKQEMFAQGVADGRTLADAWRMAYNSSKMADKTIWEASARLMADGKVLARVEQLREKISAKQLWTREQSVNVLSGIATHGEKDADRVRAVTELNSMHGFDAPKKVALTDADGNDIPTMVHVVYASISKG